jgi:hypothetical protein
LQILWRYTQQSNRSRGGGVVDGNDYNDNYNEGSGHDKDDDDGRRNDCKGQQGNGQHNDGDGRYGDAAR